MIEIIKRVQGQMPKKEHIQGVRPQISYNSDGHICIRVIQDGGNDTLIVLDCRTSIALIDFASKIKYGTAKDDGLPF